MDNTMKKLFSDAARKAADVAEGAKDAFAGASRIVGEKADVAKLSLELVRLQNERQELFCHIGETFYLLSTGRFAQDQQAGQQQIEQLLSEISEKEMLANELEARISELRGEVECPGCQKLCNAEAAFCPACGAKLR